MPRDSTATAWGRQRAVRRIAASGRIPTAAEQQLTRQLPSHGRGMVVVTHVWPANTASRGGKALAAAGDDRHEGHALLHGFRRDDACREGLPEDANGVDRSAARCHPVGRRGVGAGMAVQSDHTISFEEGTVEQARARVSLLLFFFFCFGCGGAKVTGSVTASFGDPLEGVTVKVEKSAYQATTDAGGKYSVEYAPGAFTVVFSKPGYTTHRLDLNIQAKTKFQSDRVILYPAPLDGQIIHLAAGKTATFNLSGKIEESGGSDDGEVQKSTCGGVSDLMVAPGEAVFLAKSAKARLFLQNVDGSLLSKSLGWTINKVYDGRVKDSVTEVGEERVAAHKVVLDGGKTYAWATPYETIMGDSLLEKGAPCARIKTTGEASAIQSSPNQ